PAFLVQYERALDWQDALEAPLQVRGLDLLPLRGGVGLAPGLAKRPGQELARLDVPRRIRHHATQPERRGLGIAFDEQGEPEVERQLGRDGAALDRLAKEDGGLAAVGFGAEAEQGQGLVVQHARRGALGGQARVELEGLAIASKVELGAPSLEAS